MEKKVFTLVFVAQRASHDDDRQSSSDLVSSYPDASKAKSIPTSLDEQQS